MNVANEPSTNEGSEPAETLYCARHPTVETLLRCGRCDKPICTRCQIPTPVGMRCRECAQVKRVALTNRPSELARAALAGLVASVALIYLLDILISASPLFGSLGLFAMAGIGYGVGAVVSSAARGKRSRDLAIVAVVCFVVGYFAPLLLSAGSAVLSPAFLRFLLGRILNLMVLVGLVVGGLLAWMRAR